MLGVRLFLPNLKVKSLLNEHGERGVGQDYSCLESVRNATPRGWPNEKAEGLGKGATAECGKEQHWAGPLTGLKRPFPSAVWGEGIISGGHRQMEQHRSSPLSGLPLLHFVGRGNGRIAVGAFFTDHRVSSFLSLWHNREMDTKRSAFAEATVDKSADKSARQGMEDGGWRMGPPDGLSRSVKAGQRKNKKSNGRKEHGKPHGTTAAGCGVPALPKNEGRRDGVELGRQERDGEKGVFTKRTQIAKVAICLQLVTYVLFMILTWRKTNPFSGVWAGRNEWI